MAGYDFRPEGERNFHNIIIKYGNSTEEIRENWEQIMKEYEEQYGEIFICYPGDKDYYIDEALKYKV